MNVNESRALREQRAQLFNQMQDLNTRTGLKTAEERTQFDVMDADFKALTERISRIENVERTAEEMRAANAGNGAPPNGQPNGGGAPPEDAEKLAKRKHQAWTNYLKYGLNPRQTASGHSIMGVSDEDRSILMSNRRRAIDPEDLKSINAELRAAGAPEIRDFVGGTQGGAYPGSTTGFFIPVGFVNRIEEALKYYGPFLRGGVGMPEVFDTATGQQLPFPTSNDTATMGELIGEGQQVNTGDVNIGQILLGAWKYSTKMVKVSIELLQDSQFDLEKYLVGLFSIRLGRILNNHFTVGTGSGQPNGIVTASTLGATAIGSSGNDGSSASTNTVGSDDLINLEHSVDILYRSGARYWMNDSTLRQIKTLKDKYGRPLFLPGLAVKAPDTINSYEYDVNNDIDALQATGPNSPPVTRKTILFGQMSKYLVRRVKDMSVIRLEERFADQGLVAFIGFSRYDATLLDAGTRPVKYLQNVY